MPTNTSIPTLDGKSTFPAYVVEPEGPPRGAIIVIQEIFGVNPGIARKTEDWAAAGYLAVAPDVFWRQQPGVEFNPDAPEEFQQAIGFMMKHDFEAGVQDVEAVIHWIRREQGLAKVGLEGFCMGRRTSRSVTGVALGHRNPFQAFARGDRVQQLGLGNGGAHA